MRRNLTTLAVIAAANFMSVSVLAQTADIASQNVVPIPQVKNTAPVDPDFCINTMAGFPTDDQEARYQFFRLTEEMARDATPEFRKALAQYGDNQVSPHSPMLNVIEEIANPVLRQAAPEVTVGNMAYVIDFAKFCAPFITGQIDSLKAFDPTYTNAEFNAVITEDALFLRQILSDSMLRLGAGEDPIYSSAMTQYEQALITTRDEAEFTTFEAELDDLESLYMTDLDGRLKRSNDVINAEMDREILGDSVALSDSLNEAERRKAKDRQLYTLIRILGGGG